MCAVYPSDLENSDLPRILGKGNLQVEGQPFIFSEIPIWEKSKRKSKRNLSSLCLSLFFFFFLFQKVETHRFTSRQEGTRENIDV